MKFRKGTKLLLLILICSLGAQGCTAFETGPLDWVNPTANVEAKMRGEVLTEEEFSSMQMKIEKRRIKAGEDGFIEYQGNLLATAQALEETMGLVLSSKGDRSVSRIYEANTCFFDTNALLCVQAKSTFYLEQMVCRVEKTYYYNQVIYKENSEYDMKQRMHMGEEEQVYMPVELLADIYGYELQWDKESKTGLLSGGGLAAGTFKTKVYEPMAFHVKIGSFWSTSGELVSAAEALGAEYADQFVYTAAESYIPVNAGDEFRMDFFCSWMPQVAGILFLDAQEAPISYYTFDKSTQMQRQIIKVPTGAVKMHLSMYVNQIYRMEKAVTIEGADLNKIPKSFYQEQSQKIMKANQEASHLADNWDYTPSKAYITFVVDDTRPDMDQIMAMFEKKQVPLCASTIVNNLPFVASGGTSTRAELCRQLEARGGEILVHDSEVITEKTVQDYDTLFRHFYDNKKRLELYGLHPKGTILAGGNGFIRGNDITDMWVRQFYDYSDLHGTEALKEPYFHPRTNLGYNLENYRQMVDEAISERQWLVFYFHSLNEVSLEELEEVLDYVKAQGQNRIEPITYRNLYNRIKR